MVEIKIQRVRDPVHNLIEFGTDEFEQMIWRLIQTPPFQRLRRIRQLGFSEYVFPGATHTRFAHSIGVFHTARQLMKIAEKSKGEKEHKSKVALAAALLHDIGHGMFSHAFEEVGKELKLEMARHENVSDYLIREDPDIQKAFKNHFGTGFAEDVADVIASQGAANLYNSVVSSQFDGDRLDYMQRDRLMTGVQSSGIDFSWLINNLVLADISLASDDEENETIKTFVIGAKAIHAAEAYILSLFHLYPTVYFHKTTRGMEKIFSRIMLRVATLVNDGSFAKTGLAQHHPIIRFFQSPNDMQNVLALDDTVFWGSLPLLKVADDPLISSLSARLLDRRILKCVDIYSQIFNRLGPKRGMSETNIQEAKNNVERVVNGIKIEINNKISENHDPAKTWLIDSAIRHPYKKYDETKGVLNQIYVQRGSEKPIDIVEVSPAVANLQPFQIFRIYFSTENSKEFEKFIKDTIETTIHKEN